METSLRYGGDSKSLRIHAKENFPIDSLTFFEVHGALDTIFGRPSYFSAILRHTYPDISASLGLGVQYDRLEKLRYTMRAKKAFPLSSKGLVSFNVKGRCNADQDFNKRDSKAAVEFTWSIFNFQKDQDVRFKVGYDIIDWCANQPDFHDKGVPLAVQHAAIGGAYKENMMTRFLPLNSDSKDCRNICAEICSNQSFVAH